MSRLFRDQVFAARAEARSQFGKPTPLLPPSFSWFVYGVAAFIACGLVLAFVVQIPRTTDVRGQLRFNAAEAVIRTTSSGVLSEVFVKTGQRVSVNTPLIAINQDKFLNQRGWLSEETERDINHQIASLNTEIVEAERLFDVTQRQLAARNSSLQAQIEREQRLLETVLQQRTTLEKRVTTYKDLLSEGLVSTLEFDQLQDRLKAVATEQFGLEGNIQSFQLQFEETTLEKESAAIEHQQTINGMRARISAMEAQLVQSLAETKYQLVSPIDGYVTALTVREGATVSAGDVMLAVIPMNGELVAEIQLPSDAIGFVESGQRVIMKYDAFPHQKYGVGEGSIETISGTAFTTTNTGGESVQFPIEISLDSDVLRFGSTELKLQSGMEFSARIILERRRVIELFVGRDLPRRVRAAFGGDKV